MYVTSISSIFPIYCILYMYNWKSAVIAQNYKNQGRAVSVVFLHPSGSELVNNTSIRFMHYYTNYTLRIFQIWRKLVTRSPRAPSSTQHRVDISKRGDRRGAAVPFPLPANQSWPSPSKRKCHQLGQLFSKATSSETGVRKRDSSRAGKQPRGGSSEPPPLGLIEFSSGLRCQRNIAGGKKHCPWVTALMQDLISMLERTLPPRGLGNTAVDMAPVCSPTRIP